MAKSPFKPEHLKTRIVGIAIPNYLMDEVDRIVKEKKRKSRSSLITDFIEEGLKNVH